MTTPVEESLHRLARDCEALGLQWALIGEVESLVEHEYVDRLATVRMHPPVLGGVVVDLLFASSGIEPEIVQEAERVELVPGVTVPIAQVPHLAALKLLSRDDSSRPRTPPTSSR